ncbi:MAG: hypothetical protein GX444_09720 [Myxococcales bacterium]|nr:hypothetical protein [Myxococcales bacterium]
MVNAEGRAVAFAIFRRLVGGTLLLLLCLALPLPAAAQNYQYYPIGERAAGLGGAFVAIADDASGAYYNPAGLAEAAADSFSLSATVYGYTKVAMDNALGFGESVGDMNITTFYAIPSLFGTVYHFGAGDANTVAFSIVSPDVFSYRNQTKTGEDRLLFSSRSSQQTYWFGPSYARRINRHLSAGATLYGLFGQSAFEAQLSGRLNDEDFESLRDDLRLSENFSDDRKTFGVLAQAGVRLSWNEWHLGLVARSPSLQAWGSGSHATSYLVTYQNEVDQDTKQIDFQPRRVDPFMVGLGVAYVSPLSWAASADVKYHGAAKFRDADKDEVAEDVELRQVVNGNIGLEYVAAKRFPLRAGFYTNFSPYRDEGIDTYGLTLTGGYEEKQTSFSLGLNYAWGRGDTSIARIIEKNGAIATEGATVDLDVQTINVILATSYRFGGESRDKGKNK